MDAANIINFKHQNNLSKLTSLSIRGSSICNHKFFMEMLLFVFGSSLKTINGEPINQDVLTKIQENYSKEDLEIIARFLKSGYLINDYPNSQMIIVMQLIIFQGIQKNNRSHEKYIEDIISYIAQIKDRTEIDEMDKLISNIKNDYKSVYVRDFLVKYTKFKRNNKDTELHKQITSAAIEINKIATQKEIPKIENGNYEIPIKDFYTQSQFQ